MKIGILAAFAFTGRRLWQLWFFAALTLFAFLAAVGSPVYLLMYYLAPGFRELAGLGVAAMGANCGSGPENMAAILSEMRQAAPDAVLIAKPNAGLPTIRGGEAVYSIEPEPFATYALEWIKAGAKIVGGCCGTTPRYIEEISRRMKTK